MTTQTEGKIFANKASGKLAHVADMNQLPSLIAHRCGAGLRPENTLAALDYALTQDIDGVEVDVHLTSDGVVIVHHDFCLNPIFAKRAGRHIQDVGVAINDLAYEEIRHYHVGEPDRTTQGVWQNERFVSVAGEQIPRLSDIIERMQAGTRKLLVEIKSDPSRPHLSASPETLAHAVCEQLSRFESFDQVNVISFDWRVLGEVQRLKPDLKTGYLTIGEREDYSESTWFGEFDPERFSGSIVKAATAAGADFWSPHHADLTPQAVDEARSQGLGVSAWTCNEPDDIRRMVELGIDSVTSDRPDIVNAVFAGWPHK